MNTALRATIAIVVLSGAVVLSSGVAAAAQSPVRTDTAPVRAGAPVEPGDRLSEIAGQLTSGRLLVDPDGHAEDEDLRRWIDGGPAQASSLPPK
jgi:hypothetical protein